MAKNYAFIDSQNVNLSILQQGWKLDYRRFRVYLADKYSVSRAYMFLGYIPRYQKLYVKLQTSGFELVFKPLINANQAVVKGNVDAELVLHTMIEYPNYDQAVLVSGDGDFYCLLEYLKKQDKLSAVLVPDSRRYSALFKRLGDEQIDYIETFRDKVEYKKAP